MLTAGNLGFEPFQAFNKIPRLHGDIIVTEKIDGTNACVEHFSAPDGWHGMAACSRNRRLVEMFWREESEFDCHTKWAGKGDNYGFGAWVVANRLALCSLGYGRHFGEWWGQGIQRTYGLDHKRFSLFRPRQLAPQLLELNVGNVPQLETLESFSSSQIDMIMASLKVAGSQAAEGFMDPEGIVLFHERSGQLFKYTYEAGPKGQKEE